MTRKLPADIPSPEDRGAVRPDVEKPPVPRFAAPEPFYGEPIDRWHRRVIEEFECFVNTLLVPMVLRDEGDRL